VVEGILTKRRWIAALGLLAMAGLTGEVEAHGKLKQASPAAESTVKAAPGEVIITFTEALEPKFSKIEVQNAQGQRVDQGAAQVVLGEPTRLAVALKPLPAGTYRVTWRIVSVDTHRSEGSYQFIVAP
jgi:methionine-rich copper-binding protein CopC